MFNEESTERRVEVKGDEDEQLQHYNTVLYPQMNSLTVEVTRKRKHYPAECCQHLNVMYETELSDTVSV